MDVATGLRFALDVDGLERASLDTTSPLFLPRRAAGFRRSLLAGGFEADADAGSTGAMAQLGRSGVCRGASGALTRCSLCCVERDGPSLTANSLTPVIADATLGDESGTSGKVFYIPPSICRMDDQTHENLPVQFPRHLFRSSPLGAQQKRQTMMGEVLSFLAALQSHCLHRIQQPRHCMRPQVPTMLALRRRRSHSIHELELCRDNVIHIY